jgi:hypothetical protein
VKRRSVMPGEAVNLMPDNLGPIDSNADPGYNPDSLGDHDPELAKAFGRVVGQDLVEPLADTLGLYVDVKWLDPDSPQARKTTYSQQSEANAD